MGAPEPVWHRKRDGRPFVLRVGDGRGDRAPAAVAVIYTAELPALGQVDAATLDAVFDAKEIFGPGTRLARPGECLEP